MEQPVPHPGRPVQREPANEALQTVSRRHRPALKACFYLQHRESKTDASQKQPCPSCVGGVVGGKETKLKRLNTYPVIDVVEFYTIMFQPETSCVLHLPGSEQFG